MEPNEKDGLLSKKDGVNLHWSEVPCGVITSSLEAGWASN